jgi:hypothetical protein
MVKASLLVRRVVILGTACTANISLVTSRSSTRASLKNSRSTHQALVPFIKASASSTQMLQGYSWHLKLLVVDVSVLSTFRKVGSQSLDSDKQSDT